METAKKTLQCHVSGGRERPNLLNKWLPSQFQNRICIVAANKTRLRKKQTVDVRWQIRHRLALFELWFMQPVAILNLRKYDSKTCTKRTAEMTANFRAGRGNFCREGESRRISRLTAHQTRGN